MFIVEFLQNATIEYSSESVCECVCLCVFLHDNSKSNQSRNMEFEYVVVYENISDKLWVIVKLRNFSPFTTIQNIRSYNSTLVEAR